MVDEVKAEERRILQMVSDGVVRADEGDALLAALEGGGDIVCPWCAEQIPADSVHCPECGEAIVAAAQTPQPPISLGTDLSTLEKILALLLILVGAIYLLNHIMRIDPLYFVGCLLAGCAIASGILMFKNNPLGWTLGLVWSAAQILEIIIAGVPINRQMLHVGVNLNFNGIGLGFNLVGLIFFACFIKSINQRRAVA